MKTRVPAITVFGLIATLTTLAALWHDFQMPDVSRSPFGPTSILRTSTLSSVSHG